MATFTKEQAKKMGYPNGEICPFHMNNPDQEAVMHSCGDCVYVQDPCGCHDDEGCPMCDPESFRDMEKEDE